MILPLRYDEWRNVAQPCAVVLTWLAERRPAANARDGCIQ